MQPAASTRLCSLVHVVHREVETACVALQRETLRAMRRCCVHQVFQSLQCRCPPKLQGRCPSLQKGRSLQKLRGSMT